MTGEPFWLLWKVFTIKDQETGDVVGLATVSPNITNQKQAEETLKSRNAELQSTNNNLDNFIYAASHDLKAPILNIEGLMKALLSQLPAQSLASPSVQRTTDLILGSVQRFKGTIGHPTEITRLQRQNSQEASPVHLAAVIAEVRQAGIAYFISKPLT